MEKLFIYYSHTGSGDKIAEALANKGYKTLKLTTTKRMPKAFFWQMMKGGFAAGLGVKWKINETLPEDLKTQELVIGSPIWNDRLSPVTNYLIDLLDKDLKIKFVLYSGGGTARHAAKKLFKTFPSCDVMILKEPKKYEEEIKKLDEYL